MRSEHLDKLLTMQVTAEIEGLRDDAMEDIYKVLRGATQIVAEIDDVDKQAYFLKSLVLLIPSVCDLELQHLCVRNSSMLLGSQGDQSFSRLSPSAAQVEAAFDVCSGDIIHVAIQLQCMV